jgi:O-acetylhomoserine (thiol)-lyase
MIGRIIELSDQVSERRMPMSDNLKGFATKAVHWGHTPDQDTKSRAVPLYQTTSYTFDDTEHAADLFGLRQFGNIYTRIMNPTTDVLEQRVAALEGGVGRPGRGFGQAAETLTLLTLAQAGDEIVASTDLYGGTVSLFRHTFKRLGITSRFVPPNDITPGRPPSRTDQGVFRRDHRQPQAGHHRHRENCRCGPAHGVPLVVDNTVTTPYLLNPIAHGAAIVVHSATKFIGGHGTSIGGLIVDSGPSTGRASGRFPIFWTPSPPITA